MLWLTRSELPRNIEINDRAYSIDTDFRAWIRFEEVVQDDNIADGMKLLIASDFVSLDRSAYEENSQEDIMDALFSFYRMYKPVLKASTSRNDEVAYKYTSDIGYVYSAFLQQYGINILTANMHWFEYKSLFDSLTDSTKFIQIVGYRTQSVKGMSPEQKKQALELKKLYAVTDDDFEEEKERDPREIEAELLAKLEKGGD